MKTLKIGDRLLDLSQPIVMGILNITADSFYDGGEYLVLDKALDRVGQMLEEGASLIDIGAFSSRPGAELVDAESQIKALRPVIEGIKEHYPEALLSIDAYQAEVIEGLASLGPFLVNDVTGFNLDSRLLDVVAHHNLPYALMHIKGTPKTMQSLATYDDVAFEILDYFSAKMHILATKGIKEVIIDPGFGFAKTPEQNFEILRKLEVFKILNAPLMVGLSRKSMIYKTLGSTPQQSLNGTTALHMAALHNGADILRAHDVKEAKETITLWNHLQALVNH